MKVKIEHLTKIFPSRKKDGSEVIAVNDFNYEIPDGKLIGLLGPSGCGKSTTLYMLSGLQNLAQVKFSLVKKMLQIFHRKNVVLV